MTEQSGSRTRTLAEEFGITGHLADLAAGGSLASAFAAANVIRRSRIGRMELLRANLIVMAARVARYLETGAEIGPDTPMSAFIPAGDVDAGAYLFALVVPDGQEPSRVEFDTEKRRGISALVADVWPCLVDLLEFGMIAAASDPGAPAGLDDWLRTFYRTAMTIAKSNGLPDPKTAHAQRMRLLAMQPATAHA